MKDVLPAMVRKWGEVRAGGPELDDEARDPSPRRPSHRALSHLEEHIMW